jgi:hypothetical protein
MASTLGDSLIDQLVPLVDEIRGSLNPAMGLRQYTVTVVTRRWPSGRRGDTSAGPPTDTELELEPQPKVEFGKGLDYKMEPGGRREEGRLRLTEVSLTYSEDQLAPQGLTQDQEFFYRLTEAVGQNIRSREYHPDGPIISDREKDIGWTINLVRRQVRP